MTDLAQKMTSCTFQGFDVDLAQATPHGMAALQRKSGQARSIQIVATVA